MIMERRLTKAKRRRRKRLNVFVRISIIIVIGIFFICLICIILGKLFGKSNWNFFSTSEIEKADIVELFLTPNEYSRPQIPIKKVKGVVIHYTGNPGTDARANRDYFESLKDSHTTSASSHFVIGLDGTIIQCIPLDEISYASNDRNVDTISIECCHSDETGKFSKETYQSLIELTAWLCSKYNLKSEDILRHYDVTGKECPRYYVKNEKKWEALKEDVFAYIKDNKKQNKKKHK